MPTLDYRDFAKLHTVVRQDTAWAASRLQVQQARIERLREALQATIRFLVAEGPCGDSPDDGENSHCDDEGCLYCGMDKAIGQLMTGDLD